MAYSVNSSSIHLVVLLILGVTVPSVLADDLSIGTIVGISVGGAAIASIALIGVCYRWGPDKSDGGHSSGKGQVHQFQPQPQNSGYYYGAQPQQAAVPPGQAYYHPQQQPAPMPMPQHQPQQPYSHYAPPSQAYSQQSGYYNNGSTMIPRATLSNYGN